MNKNSLFIIFAIVLGFSPAIAQETISSDIEEIVVTARAKDESIRIFQLPLRLTLKKWKI